MAPSNMLVLNRLAGLIVSGPSLMTNVNIMNSVLSSWKGSLLQISVFITVLMSMGDDILALFSLSSFIIALPGSFPNFTKYLIAYSFVKRLYSINIVHVTYLRFQAITGTRPASAANSTFSNIPALIYTFIYALLSIATATAQFMAYNTNNWDSSQARESDYFKYYYKSFNMAATSYYVLFGIYVDFRFVFLGDKNPLARQRFRRLRMFYNHWIYLAYEIIFFIAFSVGNIWGLINPDVTSALYVEQALLTFMMFNGICLVQAVSTINSGEDETTRPASTNSDTTDYKYGGSSVNGPTTSAGIGGATPNTPAMATINAMGQGYNPLPPAGQQSAYGNSGFIGAPAAAAGPTAYYNTTSGTSMSSSNTPPSAYSGHNKPTAPARDASTVKPYAASGVTSSTGGYSGGAYNPGQMYPNYGNNNNQNAQQQQYYR